MAKRNRIREDACAASFCLRIRDFPSRYCPEHRRERTERPDPRDVAAEQVNAQLREKYVALEEKRRQEELTWRQGNTFNNAKAISREKLAQITEIVPDWRAPEALQDPELGISVRFIREWDMQRDLPRTVLAPDLDVDRDRELNWYMDQNLKTVRVISDPPAKPRLVATNQPRRYSND